MARLLDGWPLAADGYPAPAMPPIAALVRGRDMSHVRAELRNLSEAEIVAMLTDPRLWDLIYQRMPGGSWLTWLLRFGRGGGKTHTGGHHLTQWAKDPGCLGGGDLALIGGTYSDVTGTMIRGPSGIIATAPADFRPILTHRDGTQILKYPNGVIAHLLSEDARERIRGKHLGGVWADELEAWIKPAYTWDHLIQPALRAGLSRAIVTTTPGPGEFLPELEARASTVTTEAPTFLNPFLPAHKRAEYIAIFGGTRLERQELFGEYAGLAADALWRQDWIDEVRHDRMPKAAELRRVVVAVDPAGTAKDTSDETGIIVVGQDYDGRIYVLADRSMRGSPMAWGRAVVSAYRDFDADKVVAEVNMGWDLVEANITAADDSVPVKQVKATRGKVIRAEPVAALYEKRLVSHVGRLPELEAQLVGWSPSKKKSPDRLDALVWGITDLALGDDGKIGPALAYASAYKGLRRKRRR